MSPAGGNRTRADRHARPVTRTAHGRRLAFLLLVPLVVVGALALLGRDESLPGVGDGVEAGTRARLPEPERVPGGSDGTPAPAGAGPVPGLTRSLAQLLPALPASAPSAPAPASREATGRVVDGDGRPIAGARLLLRGSEVGAVRSDGEGRFALRVPLRAERDPPWLLAIAPGFRNQRRELLEGRSTRVVMQPGLRLVLVLRAETPRGAVPLAHQAVRLDAAGPVPWLASTDAQGRLEATVPAGESLAVDVPLAGRVPWRARIGAAGHDRELELVVPALTVGGRLRVTDRTGGEPLAGARVAADGLALGRTDAAGELALAAYPGQPLALEVSAPGYALRSTRARFRTEGDVHPLEMVRAGEVFGVVRDARGAPVTGATVRLLIDRERFGGPLHEGVRGLRDRSVTHTRADGSYRLVGLGNAFARMKLAVEVTHPDFRTTRSASLELGLSEAAGPLDVTLAPGATLAGVVRANDDPGHAVVVLEGERRLRVRTDDAGRFRLGGLAAGDWSLAVHLEDHPQLVRRLAGSLGEGEEAALDVVFRHRPATIRGSVASADGRPLAHVPVEAVGEVEGGLPLRSLERRYRTTTDADGFYELELVQDEGPPALYTVRLARWPGDREEAGVRPPATLNLEAEPGVWVALRVLAPGSFAAPEYEARWERAGFDPSAEAALPCPLRRPGPGGGEEVLVPAAAGELVISSPGCAEERRSLGVASPDLGAIPLRPATR